MPCQVGALVGVQVDGWQIASGAAVASFMGAKLGCINMQPKLNFLALLFIWAAKVYLVKFMR